MKYLGIGTGLDDFRQVLAVGVSNEDLTELFALNHRNDPFYSFAVEPIEDIVQQQYRSLACRIGQIQSLCQFHREHKRALLTL